MKQVIYTGSGYKKSHYYYLYLILFTLLALQNGIIYIFTKNTLSIAITTLFTFILYSLILSVWLKRYDAIIEHLIKGVTGNKIRRTLWSEFDKKHWSNTLIKPYHQCFSKNEIEIYVKQAPKSTLAKFHKKASRELASFQERIEKQQITQKTEALHSHIIGEISEITRKNQTSFHEATNTVLAQICTKTNSQLGIIYFYNAKEGELKASGMFAVDRIKFTNDTKLNSEGIIGQVAKEKLATHLKDIPENYSKITSGLGKSSPNEIYISPIIYNEELVGVIELATIYSYDEKTTQLIEQLLTILSSAIRDTNNTKRDAELLRSAQEATQTMREQEEELKQNAEELQANQEELERKMSIQMRCIQQLQREEDNVIINIAGRNRMLSQQIAFYCELIYNGDNTTKEKLAKSIDLHHHTLLTLKNGGIPKGVDYILPLPASNDVVQQCIVSIESLWLKYKKAAEEILEQGNYSKLQIRFIEENTDELLKRNNELVSLYMQDSDRWRKNVFAELNNVIQMAS